MDDRGRDVERRGHESVRHDRRARSFHRRPRHALHDRRHADQHNHRPGHDNESPHRGLGRDPISGDASTEDHAAGNEKPGEPYCSGGVTIHGDDVRHAADQFQEHPRGKQRERRQAGCKHDDPPPGAVADVPSRVAQRNCQQGAGDSDRRARIRPLHHVVSGADAGDRQQSHEEADPRRPENKVERQVRRVVADVLG